MNQRVRLCWIWSPSWAAQFQTDQNAFLSQNAIFQGGLARDNGTQVGATIDQYSATPMTSVSGMKELAKPWYSDQILPFDITLAGTNEMGAATTMKIFGVEILNEGSGLSIDDAVSEMQATFVARFIEPCCRSDHSKKLFFAIDQVFARGEENPFARGPEPSAISSDSASQMGAELRFAS